MAPRGKSNDVIQVSAKYGIRLWQGAEEYPPSPPSMSRDDSKASFIVLFPWESGPEAFMGPQPFAFALSKEVISSWEVGLDRHRQQAVQAQ